MTPEHLAQEAAPVVAAADQLVAVAPKTGNSPDLTDDNVRAAVTYQAAVMSWTGTQAQEVLSGKRPYRRWHEYGVDLLRQIRQYTDEIKQTGKWWQRMFDAIGRSLDSALTTLEAKVAALQAEVARIGALREAVLSRREVLREHAGDLSQEVIDIYYGKPGDVASAAWRRLVSLTDGLVRLVGSLRSGELTLESTGDGELVAVQPDDTLSGAPVVVGILAAVAAVVALAASVRAYYTHADEVTRAEVARLELELTAQGKGEEVLALRKARTEADRAREPQGTDPLALAGKVVAGGALVLAGAWGLKLLAERFVFAPRRRAV